MDARGFQQYKQQSINTMTQGELLLLLYDELVKRLTQAELFLAKQDYPMFEGAVQRSIEIIKYLDDTLDKKYEVGRNLTRLYEYFTYQLGRTKIGRRADLLKEIKEKVIELRDAFRQAQKSGDSTK